jgi:hypothetical protein
VKLAQFEEFFFEVDDFRVEIADILVLFLVFEVEFDVLL